MPRLDGTLQAIQRWDERACARLNRAIRFRALLHLFRAVSWLGNGIFWYGLMLALLLAHGADAAPAVVHMACAGLACTLLYRLLKRERCGRGPYRSARAHRRGGGAARPVQFSLGPHAARGGVLAGRRGLLPGARAAAGGDDAAPSAASRIVLGLHYPSDVLAGAALGAAVALASLSLG